MHHTMDIFLFVSLLCRAVAHQLILGLLSVALQPYFERRVTDITVFPISISYHERMENMLYVGGQTTHLNYCIVFVLLVCDLWEARGCVG